MIAETDQRPQPLDASFDTLSLGSHVSTVNTYCTSVQYRTSTTMRGIRTVHRTPCMDGESYLTSDQRTVLYVRYCTVPSVAPSLSLGSLPPPPRARHAEEFGLANVKLNATNIGCDPVDFSVISFCFWRLGAFCSRRCSFCVGGVRLSAPSSVAAATQQQQQQQQQAQQQAHADISISILAASDAVVHFLKVSLVAFEKQRLSSLTPFPSWSPHSTITSSPIRFIRAFDRHPPPPPPQNHLPANETTHLQPSPPPPPPPNTSSPSPNTTTPKPKRLVDATHPSLVRTIGLLSIARFPLSFLVDPNRKFRTTRLNPPRFDDRLGPATSSSVSPSTLYPFAFRLSPCTLGEDRQLAYAAVVRAHRFIIKQEQNLGHAADMTITMTE